MGMVQIAEGCTLNLKGGVLSSRYLHAIRNNGGGTVTMTGGSVTVAGSESEACALDNYGTAVISGGTLTNSDVRTAVRAVADSSGAISTTTLSGSVVCKGNIYVNGTNANKANLEISSGTIDGSVNVKSYSEVTLSGGTFTGGVEEISANNTIRVTGGTYSQKPDDAYLADDALVILVDNKFYVGEDALTQISSAQSGETLEVVHGKEVTGVPAGVTVTNGTETAITVNGETVEPNGSITIPAPEQPPSPPTRPSPSPPTTRTTTRTRTPCPPVDEEAPEEARDSTWSPAAR